MDYEKIVHALIDSIVEEPDSVLIRVTHPDDKNVDIIIAAEVADTARLIGKRGIIANSLREIISVAGKSENTHVHIKFESFGDELEQED